MPCGSASRVVGEQNREHIYSVVSVFESVSVSEVVSVPVSEAPEQWVSEHACIYAGAVAVAQKADKTGVGVCNSWPRLDRYADWEAR